MQSQDLTALVRAHQAELYRYMRYLGAGDAAAQDLVQDTFLAVFQGSEPPEPGDRAAAAWLRGIARNLFLRYCRETRTAKVRADSELLERAEATWRTAFLRDGDGFDYVEALRKCLDTLSEQQREVIELRYAQRKSRLDMAAQCQMTENGIKSLLRRIRARLAECVERRLSAETV